MLAPDAPANDDSDAVPAPSGPLFPAATAPAVASSPEPSSAESTEVQPSADAPSPTEAAAATLPTPPPTAPLQSSAPADSPLAKILEGLPALSIKEQETVQKNLERLGGYPLELPLSSSWTMFFSDTSRATKSSGVNEAQYTESQTALFTVASVPALCGSLKAYKRLGGRITISPPSALIDACFERLVLAVAGSSLEAATSEIIASPDSGPGRTGIPEGLIIGAVASRRARGDRIELWLAGAKPREPAPSGWVDILKECLATELDMPELRSGKFKKHF
ncbi:hypothetical protein RQP46_008429 [Phenoliferia psychrophenolica]